MPLSKPFYAGAVYSDGKKPSEKGFTTGEESENEPVEIMFKSTRGAKFENAFRSHDSKVELGGDSEPENPEEISSNSNVAPLTQDHKSEPLEHFDLGKKDAQGQESLAETEPAESQAEIEIFDSAAEKQGDGLQEETLESDFKKEEDNPEQIPVIHSQSEADAGCPILKLSDDVAERIELEEFHSAMNLIDETARHFYNTIVDKKRQEEIVTELKECMVILDESPQDIPTLYRRIKCRTDLGYFEGALEDLMAISFLKGAEADTESHLAQEKNLLESSAQYCVDKMLIPKQPRAYFSIPSSLSIFLNDPVTNIWKNEKSRVFLELNAKLFPEGNSDETISLPEPGYSMALQHFGTEEFDLILKDLDEEVAKVNSPNIQMAVLIRGTLYQLMGYGNDALKNYDFLIASPRATTEECSSAWIKKGILLAESGNLSDSFMCFRKAEFLTPINADVYFAHAQILLLRNRDAYAASIQIEKASELAPDFELYSHWKLYIRVRLASQRHATEGIEVALLEFEPPIGPSDRPEILRVDIIALTWMGHYAQAHLKLEALNGLEPNDPRIFLGKLLLHEMMYNNDVQKRAFWFLEDAFLNYGRCAQIHEEVGHYAFGVELMEASAECFKNALSLASTHDEVIRLVKLYKTADISATVVKRFGVTPANYADKLAAFKDQAVAGSVQASLSTLRQFEK